MYSIQKLVLGEVIDYKGQQMMNKIYLTFIYMILVCLVGWLSSVLFIYFLKNISEIIMVYILSFSFSFLVIGFEIMLANIDIYIYVHSICLFIGMKNQNVLLPVTLLHYQLIFIYSLVFSCFDAKVKVVFYFLLTQAASLTLLFILLCFCLYILYLCFVFAFFLYYCYLFLLFYSDFYETSSSTF